MRGPERQPFTISNISACSLGLTLCGTMEDDFQILFDYLKNVRELAEKDKADSAENSPGDEEKKCVHEAIQTEEAYVCCKCGLVLEDIFQPDIHWCDHALMPRIYSGTDRLNAMNKALINFLDKVSLCTYLPMYTLEERLRDMKIDSGFKSLNYAICVMCILEDDEQAQEQLRPYLPRSDVAWARSLRLLSPVPEIFVRNWLRNLLKPARRDLSDRQKKRFATNFERFDDVERRTMQDLISSYRAGLDWSTNDLEKLPLPLRHALFRFSVAVCKNK